MIARLYLRYMLALSRLALFIGMRYVALSTRLLVDAAEATGATLVVIPGERYEQTKG